MKAKHSSYLAGVIPNKEGHSLKSPIKSPSPDQKRSNVITPTKSPQIDEIQHNLNMISNSRKNQYGLSETRYYSILAEDRQSYKKEPGSSQISHQKVHIQHEQCIQCRTSVSPYRCFHEEDYIQMLREKENTIKELRRLITVINQNPNERYSAEFYKKEPKSSLRDLKESDSSKELKNQNKTLIIENQRLIGIIEAKEQHSQPKGKDFGDLHQILNSKNAEVMELQRQINLRDQKLSNSDRQLKAIWEENEKLRSDRAKESQITVSGNGGKEKLSLIKIKDQYNENIKAIQIRTQAQFENLNDNFEKIIVDLHQKIDAMSRKVTILESMLLAHQKSKFKLKDQESDYQVTDRDERIDLAPIVEQPSREEDERRESTYREIQSILLEKNEQTMQLNRSRQENRELLKELEGRNRQLHSLEQAYEQLLASNKESGSKEEYERKKKEHQHKQNLRKDEQIAKLIQENKELRSLQQAHELLLASKKESGSKEEFERKKREYDQKQNLRKDQQIAKLTQENRELQSVEQAYELLLSSTKESGLKEEYERKKKEHEHKQSILKDEQIEKLMQENKELYEALEAKNDQILSLEQAYEKIRVRAPEEKKELPKEKKEQLPKEKPESDSKRMKQLQEQVSQFQFTSQIQGSMIETLKEEIDRRKNQLDSLQKANNQQLHDKVVILTKQKDQALSRVKLLEQASGNEEKFKKMEQNITELIHNYEKQLEMLRESLTLQQKQNQQSATEIEAISRNSNALTVKYQQAVSTNAELQRTLEKVSKETDDLRNKNSSLQLELQKTNEGNQLKISQYEQLVDSLKKQVEKEENRSNDSQKEITHFQASVNQLENQRRLAYESWETERIKLINKYEHSEGETAKKLREYEQLISTLRKTTIINELNEIKHELHDYYEVRTRKDLNFVTIYQQIISEKEAGIQNCAKLEAQVCQLRDQLVKQAQEKELLKEKVQFLQNNITIYENELKERKQLCERLIEEKAKVKQEMLMLKKIKVDQNQIQAENTEAYRKINDKIVKLTENVIEREEKIETVLSHIPRSTS